MASTDLRPAFRAFPRESGTVVDPHEEVVDLPAPGRFDLWLPVTGLVAAGAVLASVVGVFVLPSWTWAPAAVLALGTLAGPIGALAAFEHGGFRLRLTSRRWVVERLGRRVERVASVALEQIGEVGTEQGALVVVDGDRRWRIPAGAEAAGLADHLREAARRARASAAPEDVGALAAVRALSPAAVSEVSRAPRSVLLRASWVWAALAWSVGTVLVGHASWRELSFEQGWEPPIVLTVPEVGNVAELPADARVTVPEACLYVGDSRIDPLVDHVDFPLQSADHRSDPVRAWVSFPTDRYLEAMCWKRVTLELVVRRRAVGSKLYLADEGPDTTRWWCLLALLFLGPSALTAQGVLIGRVERGRSVRRSP